MWSSKYSYLQKKVTKAQSFSLYFRHLRSTKIVTVAVNVVVGARAPSSVSSYNHVPRENNEIIIWQLCMAGHGVLPSHCFYCVSQALVFVKHIAPHFTCRVP